MQKIKCPSCGKEFTLEEKDYTDILKQVRNKEFNDEVNDKLNQAKKQFESEIKLIEEQVKNEYEQKIFEKKQELSDQEKKISELESKTQILAKQNELAIKESLESKEQELNELRHKLTNYDVVKDNEMKDLEKSLSEKINNKEQELLKLKSRLELQVKESLESKEQELNELRNKLTNYDVVKDNEMKDLEKSLSEKINNKEQELLKLTSRLELQVKENELEKSTLKDKHIFELKQKDELIALYKDLKAKQSTKMIGENLEQHCEYEFDRLRMSAFKNAEFYKDNDASSGTKGDYIYKEYDENGIEVISIMFEMKNESDDTINGKKNKDFFKKLDKDRKEKNCEYAILVSLLELDNELYNTGIVDVSYEYDKMYVIRPQFFIPIITLLRNAALNSMQYKQELAIIREQNIDISDFEDKINLFKENFMINAKNFNSNLEQLDKNLEDSIKKLTAARENLRLSMKNLGIAENKLDDLNIKRLTRGNPTMKEKFEKLNKDE